MINYLNSKCRDIASHDIYVNLNETFCLSDGNFLAIGSHDNYIYIYAVTDNGRKYSRVGKCSVSFCSICFLFFCETTWSLHLKENMVRNWVSWSMWALVRRVEKSTSACKHVFLGNSAVGSGVHLLGCCISALVNTFHFWSKLPIKASFR